jgi:acyl CoA:acetate/3-ketoacid CoA transferase beta subunit
VYTDLAVFHIVCGELRLAECAPGITPDLIAERTGAPFVEDLPG